MKFPAVITLAWLLAPPVLSESRSINFSARRSPPSGTSLNVTNINNNDYVTNVTVNGHNFIVQLDTGSSDFWVYPKLSNVNETKTVINITYGRGFASGNAAYGDVVIGNYFIPKQAFLNADKIDQNDTIGILGLGFDKSSVILGNLSAANGPPNKAALPPLANIFNMNPTEPNFIALSLNRTQDDEDIAGGTFTISEYEPQFGAVANTTKFPVTPSDSHNWAIALNKVTVNGQTIPLNSTVPNVPGNVSIAVIDSGTSIAFVPPPLVQFIYGSIPGARNITANGSSTWLVPCMGTANLTFTFGTEDFAINPLDLTMFQTVTQSGKNYTTCQNAFAAPLQEGGGEVLGQGKFDLLLGDSFMRNVYTVFNFGNETLAGNFTGTPSIQFMSVTNQSAAYAAFNASRSAALASLPPVIDPNDVQ